MERDRISTVEIDSQGRLHIYPATRSFQYIYREAMDVQWDEMRKSLHSPIPREWTYGRWLRRIIAAAREQNCELQLSEDTLWINVSPGTKAELQKAE